MNRNIAALRPALNSAIRPILRAKPVFPLAASRTGLSAFRTPLSPLSRPYSDQIKIDKPTYQLTFTCKACTERSSHLVSKQAYHQGTVLIQCPSCKNRHLIADHLKIFGEEAKTLEDILKEKGEKITTASLDQVGDLEWEPETEPKEINAAQVSGKTQ